MTLNLLQQLTYYFFFRNKIYSMGLVFTISFILIGCDIKKPSVDMSSYSPLVFNHKNISSNCFSCHSEIRPSPIPAPTYSPWAEYVHYNNQDCNNCHVANSKWNIHNFSHLPTPANCSQCHEKDRPAPLTGLSHGAGGDCSSCHTAEHTWTSSTGIYVHPENLTSCVLCHEKNRPLSFLKNDIISVHNLTTDCVNCHKPTGWIPASSFDHTSTTSSCSSCHAAGMTNDKSITTMHNGLPHPITGDCNTCHLTNAFSPATSFGTHSGVSTSCASCHTTNGIYISLAKDALASTMTLANGETHPTSASGDCSICHIYSTNIEFKGGAVSYSHEPRPTTCVACHELGSTVAGSMRITSGTIKATRPSTHTVANASIQKQTGDCNLCHSSTSNWNTSFGDLNALHLSKTTCNECHATAGSYPLMVSEFYITKPATTKKVNHSLNLTLGVLDDCSKCHTYANKWLKPSKYYHDQDSNTITCSDCHSGSGIAQTKTPLTMLPQDPIAHPTKISTCNSCHDSDKPWRDNSTDFNHEFPTTGATKCKICHESNGGTTNSNETQRPTTMTVGNATIGSLTFNHPGAGFECNLCHNTPGAGSGHNLPVSPTTYSFLNAKAFKATNFQTHSTLPAISTLPTNTPTKLCIGCHLNFSDGYITSTTNTPPAGTGNSSQVRKAKGITGHYNLSPSPTPVAQPNSVNYTAPTDCATCHNTSRWDNARSDHKNSNRSNYIWAYLSTSNSQINSPSLGKFNCNGCHR